MIDWSKLLSTFIFAPPTQKIEEMHAFATSELRGQVEAQVRAAAEAQEVMEGKHHAALAALKAEHAKEKVCRIGGSDLSIGSKGCV